MKYGETFSKLLLSTAFLALLSACGGGGGSGGGTSSTSTSVSPLMELPNMSGATTVLDGVWFSRCYSTDGIDGIRATLTFQDYLAVAGYSIFQGDPTCSGVSSAATYVKYSNPTVADSVQTTSGWVTIDNTTLAMIPVSAPVAADGSGPLPDNAPYSLISGTVMESTEPNVDVGSVSSPFPLAVVVDATGAAPEFYAVVQDGSGNTVAVVNWFYGQCFDLASCQKL